MAAFWAAVGDTVAVFPLTAPVRGALLQLMCAGSPGSDGQGGLQYIAAPAVFGILLRLLLSCEDYDERSATLESLLALLGAHYARQKII